MNKTEILFLLDYGHWATGRVLDAATGLSAEQFSACPVVHTLSLRDTLVHMLDADRLWRIRMEAGVSPPTLVAAEFPNPAALRERWHDEERAMRAYLLTIEEAALDSSYRYRRSTGEISVPFTRWHTLMHVINHGTQHRSEAALLLTVLDRSPGDLDFDWFLHERP